MTLHAVTIGCQAVRAICTSADIVIDAEKMYEQVELLRGASILTRSSLLALNLFELVGTAFGKIDANGGYSLKQAEFIIRMLDLPINLTKATDSLKNARSGTQTVAGVIRVFETGLINPILGLTRTISEREIFREKQYLAMSDEQLAQQQRPVYCYDGDGDLSLVGYKQVTREECNEIIRMTEKALPYLQIAETVTQLAPAEIFYRCLAARLLNQNMQRRMRQQQAPAAPQGGPGNAPAPQPHVAAPQLPRVANVPASVQAANGDELVLVDNIFKLTQLRSIPSEFENDEVFKQFTCCISQMPIRDPVADPTTQGRTLYERSAITTWLRRNPTSPVSKQQLFVAQLQERADIKEMIDRRLAYHEAELRKTIHVTLNQPTPAPVPAPAAAAEPRS